MPAHDERDFEFANKYQLPIKQVYAPAKQRQTTTASNGATGMPPRMTTSAVSIAANTMAKASPPPSMRSSPTWKPMARTRRSSACATGGISLAQRYWELSDSDHPLRLLWRRASASRAVAGGIAGKRGAGRRRFAIGKMPEFYEPPVPKCGGAAKRETDTMDTLRRIELVFRPLCLAEVRRRHGGMVELRTIWRQWISISAVSNTRFCTCCTHVSSTS